jgi:DNA repair protein RecN (Recombination protein N)
MLRRLFVRDFVIVDSLELDFAAGFGALTGETGAGKSILIDALSLALGERGDASLVRTGCERAEIAAEFDLAAVGGGDAVPAWLRANDYEADDALLLRRVVDGGGRSRAYINGMPATLGQLREVGDLLVDIHGQHAHLSLLKPDAQRRLFDAQAGLTEVAREVGARHRDWRMLHEARLKAAGDVEALRRERDLLEWQVKELAALDFDAAQWLDDNAEHSRLSHAVSLIEGVEAALALLDESGAATELVDQAVSKIGHLVEHDAALREPAELLDGARIQLSEAAHALSRYRERLELDPGRLAELEARIEAVMAAARKHRIAPEELADTLATLQQRLDELSAAADPEALAAKEAAALAHYREAAAKLSKGRAKAAKELGEAVTDAMQQLAMAGGRFEVALDPLDAPAAFGMETVEFRVAANAGQPPRQLSRTASGGELSRIGLAIQVIASSASEAPTLIFDEVDVGIGGGVAEIVGRLLKQLGRDRQVLCVTHLPQVAAQADWQWSIAKETADGVTLSRVAALDAAGRVDEIARMLGGVRITDTTRKHAREMLGLKGA